MLLNNFFTILKQESDGGSVKAVVSFDKSHSIFKGHFPGHPVVPGVTMVQTLREIMEIETGTELKISTGDNLKFLAVINPEEHHQVEIAINYTVNGNVYLVNATLSAGPVIFFKFKGTLEKK